MPGVAEGVGVSEIPGEVAGVPEWGGKVPDECDDIVEMWLF